MNNIIAAIDFSDCSINALEHAITIADKGGYKIIMVWVNNPTTTKILLSSDRSDELKNEVDAQFKHLIEKYSPRLFPHHLEYVIREGKVYQQVVQQAKESDAVMIIAGTHGASGFVEYWAGSNANKIITMAQCPVITIRGGVSVSRDLKKIVLPVDSTPETRQKAAFTATIAKLFNAEVLVLALLKSDVRNIQLQIESYAMQVVEFMKDQQIKSSFDSRPTNNNAMTTLEYALEKKANLISIMTEQETSPSNLWLGPYAQQIVNSSPIPVLSIHPITLNLSMG
ncbi:MAG: universal stress protein [Bacteroidales bacterium]|nr:universal stress protein [Bacteroidales bacterium]MDZ4205460.1 universal stress protein [Bacteroidales bacterium]